MACLTTVESAVLASGECNSLAYEVSNASKAKRQRTRHGIRRDWSALTRAFQDSGPLLRQQSTEGFVVSTADAAPDPSASKLTWAPPRLTLPTTIDVGREGGQFDLQSGRDYVVKVGDVSGPVASSAVETSSSSVDTSRFPGRVPMRRSPRGSGCISRGKRERCMSKVLIDNAGGDLTEGIQINAPDAVVQIENCRIKGIHARDEVNFTDNHPDLIQPWGHVKALPVDRFTGHSDYQGILLKEDAGPIGSADLRRLNIIGLPTARYLFIQYSFIPVDLENVWLSPGKDRFTESGRPSRPTTPAATRGRRRSRPTARSGGRRQLGSPASSIRERRRTATRYPMALPDWITTPPATGKRTSHRGQPRATSTIAAACRAPHISPGHRVAEPQRWPACSAPNSMR